MTATKAQFMTLLLVWILPPVALHFGMKLFVIELGTGQQSTLSIALIFVMNRLVKDFIRRRWGAEYVPNL